MTTTDPRRMTADWSDLTGDGVVEVAIDYRDPDRVEIVSELKALGFRWNPDSRTWEYAVRRARTETPDDSLRRVIQMAERVLDIPSIAIHHARVTSPAAAAAQNDWLRTLYGTRTVTIAYAHRFPEPQPSGAVWEWRTFQYTIH